MKIKAVIEIPMGSHYKYEKCKETGALLLDRALNQAMPANYGFIDQTLAEDNDPLDVFIITQWPIEALSQCVIEPLGVFVCKDNGAGDHKIIARLEGEGAFPNWNKQLEDIQKFLSTYKTGFEVLSYENSITAREIIEDNAKAFKQRADE